MKKEVQKKASIISTPLILLILILIASYIIYINLPLNPQELNVLVEKPEAEEPIVANAEIKQFYPNMKFNHNKITYKIDLNCQIDKRTRMELAIKELNENLPTISFEETSFKPDIDISCTENSGLKVDEKHFVAGEGGAKEIIQTKRYNIITSGIILLYDNNKERLRECFYPNVELHELLHVFGFDHSTDKRSIMYPFIESCNQKLDQNIIDQLNTLYSEENLPDLYFEKVQVTKKGRYLDFSLTIRNSGSIESQPFTLTILDELEIIDQRDFNSINFGSGVTLNTTNLKLKNLNPSQINFIIDKENKIKEIDENNNVANILLS